jgi:predicted RNase H-like HicB family nuclease
MASEQTKYLVEVPSKYTLVMDEDANGWYNVTCLELPQVITCGRTEAAALDMALDAINEYRLLLLEESKAEGVTFHGE